MDELERVAQKFEREVELLGMQIDRILESPSSEALELAVSQSKRVRRDATILVRKLAEERDNLQPGGTRK